ncbi:MULTISPECIES: NAD(P)(+) transhydrogenase (Re/Si-specific) subunit beta [unclassified Treponema]|uniref:NAD(P)(+) transhydrogenase (Re/Si-specific) subunit beta n=1 Tax=unclassified Treponema TaxID=2638727 RepID=UPI0020A383BC|nr:MULTISPECIES: NAD(P)(+) transhydrogenase (Re/Si-specific) subunit beta [unclassified Treponema]UTC65896.1 NAD(P)(+) transhydrogenase (Re/Si-specific) subunit beta [Treponema sp. OMZ 789]UTC68624.1 NAD(P)(+) transhydrogenase (Re/Si-specific) subunit beta [Treponema sp. OMZ 790]UTC71354.1 NAD(P)(+) transhydrogenase (Re/Si-specific) subunit beta [Treponema sp. OMZ 791]
MTDTVYYIICGVLSIGVLLGINMMSKVKSAVKGNCLSALCMLAAVCVTLYKYQIFSAGMMWAGLAIGAAIGIYLTIKVEMITMPQTVALLNGLGGAASAVAALLTLAAANGKTGIFAIVTGGIALAVGALTFSGSLIAAGKLHKLLPQKPTVLPAHQALTTISFLGMIVFIVLLPIKPELMMSISIAGLVISILFGIFFAIRVGGADMPITISLLNSTSGVAASIAGMAIGDILLVSVGGIVGASGLLLTQIMCRAMNRSLASILFSKAASPAKSAKPAQPSELSAKEAAEKQNTQSAETKPAQNELTATGHADKSQLPSWFSDAKEIIFIPGYGMALSQAQGLVKQLADKLESMRKNVRFAIHPVAGRMPGHMNVLLCEVDIPYDKLYEMETINPDFDKTDLAIIIGASDVVNPAANTAEGTPIYGMPVLAAEKAKKLIICNFDLQPGYAGVPNPLYEPNPNTMMLLGDAKESINTMLDSLRTKSASGGASVSTGGGNTGEAASGNQPAEAQIGPWFNEAREIIVIPGYGMALSQAQGLVKQLADKLESMGKNVRFAIHPVAGRMPGHMNVLLCEVDIPYDKLYEMETINPDFDKTDLAIIIGASDVVNPAANTAEGTPIYGMPVLAAEKAKKLIICNFDLQPGYAGVPNPLYEPNPNTMMLLGDAKDSLNKILENL